MRGDTAAVVCFETDIQCDVYEAWKGARTSVDQMDYPVDMHVSIAFDPRDRTVWYTAKFHCLQLNALWYKNEGMIHAFGTC